jgi:hypothetical protein
MKKKGNLNVRVGDVLLLSLIVPKIKFKNKLKKRRCWHNKMRPIKKNVNFLLTKKTKVWRKKLKFGICFLYTQTLLGIRRVFRKRTGVSYFTKIQSPNIILIDILKQNDKKFTRAVLGNLKTTFLKSQTRNFPLRRVRRNNK